MDAYLFQAKCGRPLATAGSAGEGSSVRAVKGESALRVGTNYAIGRGSRAVHACEGSEQAPMYVQDIPYLKRVHDVVMVMLVAKRILRERES